MKKIILSIMCFLLFSTLSFAQTVQKSVDDLSTKTSAVIRMNENLGIAEFVKFPHANPLALEGNTVYDKALSFLESYKGIYDIKVVNETLHYEATKTDLYGFKHVTLLQTHGGVPVFDGKLMFHFNAEEKLTAINGNYIPNIKLNPVPFLGQDQATSIALETVNNQNIIFPVSHYM